MIRFLCGARIMRLVSTKVNAMTAHNGNGHADNRPRPREEWIGRRHAAAAETGDSNFSQMHFARKGLITEEMMYVPDREKIRPELVRHEIAPARITIPPTATHPPFYPHPT